MKTITKFLISVGLISLITGMVISCNTKPTHSSPHSTTSVDTTKYTDVVLINKSNLDSVQVFITLQSTESIVGKFGMDSTNFNPNAKNPDGTPVQCKGIFWAKKGIVCNRRQGIWG
jgi:hypothetical protein